MKLHKDSTPARPNPANHVGSSESQPDQQTILKRSRAISAGSSAVANKEGGAYFRSADDYLERGFSPIPLPPKAKFPPPKDFTGRNGRTPDRPQVEAWKTTHGDGNVALRLTNGTIGIDIDAYHDGLESLAGLEGRWGKLPSTASSTARNDGSGIRLYRVTSGGEFASNPAAGIDIVQHSHRYLVAPPSVHPELGDCYRWVDSDTGEDLDEAPNLEDLPYLPTSWDEGLRRQPSHSSSAPAATEDEVGDFLDAFDSGGGESYLEQLEEHLLQQRTEGKSRHDTLVREAVGSLRDAAAGFVSAKAVHQSLHAWWISVMDDEERLEGSEFDDAISWAVGQIQLTEDPTWTTGKSALNTGAPAPIRIPRRWDQGALSSDLADHLRGSFRWTQDGWFAWDGKRWVRDILESVYEATRRYLLDLEQAIRSAGGADPDLLRTVRKQRNRSTMDALVNLAQRQEGIATSFEDFDAHPHLLNTQSGVVDLRTGDLFPHDRDQLHSKITHSSYVPGCTHPDLEAMIDVVEPDVRKWLQVILGYASTGDVSEDLVAVLDGAGANGKSTLIGAVAAALGDYAKPMPAQLVTASAHSEHPTLIASLKGVRLAYIEELPADGTLNEERLKAISSGTQISARYMYQDYFAFMPTHSLFIATNYRPRVQQSQHALWRRLKLVPFTKTFRPPSDGDPSSLPIDTGLRSRLQRGADQRDAVLTWMIEGARRWYQNGIPTCLTIDDATDQWRTSEDVIKRFSNECLNFGTTHSTTAQELYETFTSWCAAENRPAWNNKLFKERFEGHPIYTEASIHRSRPAGRVTYRGVGVVEEVRAGEGCP